MNNIQVKTALITAAGKGARLYPLTLETDKSFLKINEKPIIFYIVQEAIKSGINKVIIVANYKSKEKIAESFLNIKNKFSSFAKIIILYQKKPTGLPGAILVAEKYIDNKFALMLGDNIMEGAGIKELMDTAQEENIVGIKKVSLKNNSLYGILEKNKKSIKVIEKPTNSKGTNAVIGRYIFSKKIFKFLKENKNEQYSVTTYINFLSSSKNIKFISIKSKFYDVGSLGGLNSARLKMKDK